MNTRMWRTAGLAVTLLMTAAALQADDEPPAYAHSLGELVMLDNGVVIDGRDLETADGYTSGFSLSAGFSPWRLPLVDLGAEVSYRESDEVPMNLSQRSLLLDTTSLGASLVAGIRLGQLGLYAKTGLAEWEGEPVIRRDDMDMAGTGTTRVQGFGARVRIDRVISRLEFEEYEASSMEHLNMLTASVHIPF